MANVGVLCLRLYETILKLYVGPYIPNTERPAALDQNYVNICAHLTQPCCDLFTQIHLLYEP